MATADKLQNIINSKDNIKTNTNYALTNKIDNTTKFIDYGKKIFEGIINTLNNPDEIFNNLPKQTASGSNISLNNTIEAPMRIELSPTELTQDGTPTPSSPQDIHTISGSNTIRVMGKNLFDGANAVYKNNYILNDSGTEISDSGGGYTKMYIPVNSNTAYTISGLGSSGTKRIYYFNSSKTFISRTSGFSGTSNTFTTPNNCKYVDIQYATSGNNFNTYMLEKGSTATTYTPYISQEADIDLKSKNLFDNTNITAGYRISTSGDNYAENGGFISSFIKVKPNTQYSKNSPVIDAFHRIAYYTTNSISGFISYTDNSNTITTPATCNYIRFCGQAVELMTAQFEEGNQITSYEEYFTPIEYCKIGNYEDRIFKNVSGDTDYSNTREDGAWYIKKNIGKAIITSFNGKSGATANNQFSTVVISNILKPSAGTIQSAILSNRFISRTPNYIYGHDVEGIGINTDGSITIGFGLSSGINTLELANTYASSNEIVAYYPLATPTYTKIEGTLANQLEAVKKSKDGITNISQVNNDLAFGLSVSALEDLG